MVSSESLAVPERREAPISESATRRSQSKRRRVRVVAALTRRPSSDLQSLGDERKNRDGEVVGDWG